MCVCFLLNLFLVAENKNETTFSALMPQCVFIRIMCRARVALMYRHPLLLGTIATCWAGMLAWEVSSRVCVDVMCFVLRNAPDRFDLISKSLELCLGFWLLVAQGEFCGMLQSTSLHLRRVAFTLQNRCGLNWSQLWPRDAAQRQGLAQWADVIDLDSY